MMVVNQSVCPNMTDSQVACRDSDRTSSRTADVLRNVAELELIEAPTLSFVPPKSYNNLPQLRGDAQLFWSLCHCLRPNPWQVMCSHNS